MATTRGTDHQIDMSRTVADDPILRAAYTLLCEVGTRRLTVALVAQRAGVSRMTVYRKQGDLDRILRTIITAEVAHLLELVEAEASEISPVREALATGVARVVSSLGVHPVMRSVLSGEPDTLLPYFTQRLGSAQTFLVTHLAEWIRLGMADGSVRESDPDEIALGIVIACQSYVAARQIVESRGLDVERQVHDLVSRWLAPEAGA